MSDEKKPVIVYVDDEPRNLAVFEASMPDDWTVVCFDSAVDALKKIKELSPAVIVSDQRMPSMTGLEFLEVASQLVPDAVRIVVTGQTEEQTIVQLVRRAKIFDYITKPWDVDLLLAQLTEAIAFNRMVLERKHFLDLLNVKNRELEDSNKEFQKLTQQLKDANEREVELRQEIGAWAPAPIVWAIKSKSMSFPVRKDLVGITYDIIDSSALKGTLINDVTARSHVLKLFIQSLVKHGGLRESAAGDSVYGHFGAVELKHNPHTAALAAAAEFRVALRNFTRLHNIDIETGIALHHAPKTLIQVHDIQVDSEQGHVVQKLFDTDSSHVDLLHRMEKIVHTLPGSNIVISKDFLDLIPEAPRAIVHLGLILFKGQAREVDLYLLPSDRVTSEQLEAFKLAYQFRATTPLSGQAA